MQNSGPPLHGWHAPEKVFASLGFGSVAWRSARAALQEIF
ncbi:hypothetical protein SynSYN20_03098 [Synechococcus sp. SYN20]|nr:hypothetical protein SynSYN20_03098 [Synechococcus sp. SYN20]